MLAAFEPTQLRAAVIEAIRLHPDTATAPAMPSPDAVQQLKRRVVAARAQDRLEELAAVLTPRDVKGLVTGLLLWEDLRPAVVTLLRLKIKPSIAPLLWTAWQRIPQLPELRELLAELPAEAWHFLHQTVRSEAPAWVISEDAGIPIQAWAEQHGLTHEELPSIAGNVFVPETPLMRLVHEAVLTHGSEDQLRRESPRSLFTLGRELAAAGKRSAFGRNYLVRMPAPAWHDQILELIRNTYGMPRRPRLPTFWETIPEEIRNAFQKRFIDKSLKDVFKDATERHRYWSKWSGALTDIAKGNAGNTPFAVLLFENFGVIEFFEVGNAAYFYDLPQAESYLQRRAYGPSDLKDVQPRFLRFSTDNRLIHHHGWESRADRLVQACLRGMHRKV